MATVSSDRRRLRREAEKRAMKTGEPARLAGKDSESLRHELSVHEIELQMQNDHLRTLQEDLETSLARYADLYHNSPVGYLTLTQKGVISDMNVTAASLLGASRSLLLKKPFAVFVTRGSVDAFFRHTYEVLCSPGKRTCELTLQRRFGGLFPAQLESIAHEHDGDMVIHTVLTDITERKRMDEAVRARLADTRLLQAVSAELLHEDSIQALCEKIVEAASRIMRSAYASMQVLEAGELRLLASCGLDPHAAKFWEGADPAGSTCSIALRTGARVLVPDVAQCNGLLATEDCAMLLQNGVHACQTTPLFSRAGKMVGTISTQWREPHETSEHDLHLLDALARQAADLIERSDAEEALKKAKAELELRVEERTEELQSAYDRLLEETREREELEKQMRQAQKMEALGTLTGGIAHDFNNILAVIVGFTELAKDRAFKGSIQEEHLDKVLQAGMRGRDLVRQMLSFSRRTEQVKEPLQLGSLIKESMKLLRASIPSTIRVRVKVENESGLVLADPTQLQQVLMNLCTNAAHAMREKGGVLEVTVGECSASLDLSTHGMKEGPSIALTVRDTGVGMPPEIVERVFEPFFTTKDLAEGTGLGLSVVHGIVRQHEGCITVESEPEKGSTFTVYLPKVGERTRAKTAKDEPVPSGHERVLYLDDEEALTGIGKGMLQKLGYEVTVMNDPTEALALFKADAARFDLVITDQTMPGLTGMDLFKEIRSIRQDLPVILVTGYSDLVDAEKAIAAGIGAFVMKPLTKREIARTIRQVLDG